MTTYIPKHQFNINDILHINNNDQYLSPNTNINKEKMPMNTKKNKDDRQNLNINNIDKNNPKKDLKENQNNKVNINKNETKGMISNNKNEKQNNILTPDAKDDSNNDVNEYINELLSIKKSQLLTNYQYVSLENKIGENSCFINVIIHFLYIFPCVNDYLIRKYKKKVEKESKKNEENNNKKETKDPKENEKKMDNQEYVDENQINNIPNPNNNPMRELKEKKEKTKNEKNMETPNKKGKDEEFLFYLGKILKDMKLPKFLIKGPLQNLKSIYCTNFRDDSKLTNSSIISMKYKKKFFLILMEYCDGNTLEDVIKKHKDEINTIPKRLWQMQCCTATLQRVVGCKQLRWQHKLIIPDDGKEILRCSDVLFL